MSRLGLWSARWRGIEPSKSAQDLWSLRRKGHKAELTWQNTLQVCMICISRRCASGWNHTHMNVHNLVDAASECLH